MATTAFPTVVEPRVDPSRGRATHTSGKKLKVNPSVAAPPPGGANISPTSVVHQFDLSRVFNRRPSMCITGLVQCQLASIMTPRVPGDGLPVSVFDADLESLKNGISLDAFLIRLDKYLRMSDSCYIYALIYLRRLDPKRVVVSKTSIHRLWLTALIVALKFHDSQYYQSSWYSRVAGISVQELNALQLDFLFCCHWRAHVSKEEFGTYMRRLLPQKYGVSDSSIDMEFHEEGEEFGAPLLTEEVDPVSLPPSHR